MFNVITPDFIFFIFSDWVLICFYLLRKKTNPVDSMVFACVSMTARAVGPKMAAKDKFFMEIIFQMLGGVELR